MKRRFTPLKFCFEVCRNPGKASELVNGWGTPILIWILASIVFMWSAGGYYVASYSLIHGFVMMLGLSIISPIPMGLLWIYTWAVFFILSKLFERFGKKEAVGVDPKSLFKLIGICFSPLLLGGLINIIVALLFFRSPLGPTFIVAVASLAYFVYCIVKALQAGLKDWAYIAGFAYVIISLVLWFGIVV